MNLRWQLAGTSFWQDPIPILKYCPVGQTLFVLNPFRHVYHCLHMLLTRWLPLETGGAQSGSVGITKEEYSINQLINQSIRAIFALV